MSGMVILRTQRLEKSWLGKLELNRWTATEIRWQRKLVSRGSAVLSVALLPISCTNPCPSSAIVPRVSTATGKKQVTGRQTSVLGSLSLWRGCSSTTSLDRALWDIGCRQCVDNGHVPGGAVSWLSWNQGHTVRPPMAPWLLEFLLW